MKIPCIQQNFPFSLPRVTQKLDKAQLNSPLMWDSSPPSFLVQTAGEWAESLGNEEGEICFSKR